MKNSIMKVTSQLNIFLNPISGNGKALQVYRKLKQLLQKEEIQYQTYIGPHPNSLYTRVQEYAASPHPAEEVIVVIGRDGTFNEVLNGLKHSPRPNLPLAYLPAGSGNDFARAAGLTTDPQEFIKRISQAKTVTVDCGSFTYASEPEKRHYFVNNFGIGFDAYVVHLSNNQKLKNELNHFHLGKFIYGLNILSVLRKQNTFAVTIKTAEKSYHYGDAYFVTTTNHPYFGGGIAILPSANIESHVLDTVVVEKPGLGKFIRLFAKLLKDGSHVTDPQFHDIQAKEIHVETHKPQYRQIDGEDGERASYAVTFRIDHFNLIK
ncbi:diacylglycerol/lipid kinase family protein [Lactobacillus xujianguonis]|nr:diacylglycerol kinase family protein [Lactobacillus xujianguonis]